MSQIRTGLQDCRPRGPFRGCEAAASGSTGAMVRAAWILVSPSRLSSSPLTIGTHGPGRPFHARAAASWTSGTLPPSIRSTVPSAPLSPSCASEIVAAIRTIGSASWLKALQGRPRAIGFNPAQAFRGRRPCLGIRGLDQRQQTGFTGGPDLAQGFRDGRRSAARRGGLLVETLQGGRIAGTGHRGVALHPRCRPLRAARRAPVARRRRGPRRARASAGRLRSAALAARDLLQHADRHRLEKSGIVCMPGRDPLLVRVQPAHRRRRRQRADLQRQRRAIPRPALQNDVCALDRGIVLSAQHRAPSGGERRRGPIPAAPAARSLRDPSGARAPARVPPQA